MYKCAVLVIFHPQELQTSRALSPCWFMSKPAKILELNISLKSVEC